MATAPAGGKGGGAGAPGGKGGAGASGGARAPGGAAPGNKGGSIYDQAAGATNAAYGAGNRLLGELNRGPGGVKADLLSGPAGYRASTYTGQGYNAATQATPASIASGIAGYMNPYTNEVINNTSRDINRQTQLGLNSLGADAVGKGAFGGSRLGVAEGVAAGEGARALGDFSSQLRAQGFNTAADLSGKDIANRMTTGYQNQAALNEARQFGAGALNTSNQYNATARTSAASDRADAMNRAAEINRQAVANMRTTNLGQRNDWLNQVSSAATQAQNMGQAGVNLGQQLQSATGADANTVNGIVQSLMGQSAGMFDSYTSAPFAGIERVLGALSGNPLSRTGTQTGTQTPGLKSQLATAAGIASKAFMPVP